MKRQTRRALLLATPAALVLAVEGLFGTPLRVAYHARALRSADPMARLAAREALLALGRPAIDPVLPELATRYAFEEVASGGAVLLAASIASAGSTVEVRVERPLYVEDPRAFEPDVLRAVDEREHSPAARRIAALLGGGGGRALAVVGLREGRPVLRSAFPVEGDLGAAVVRAFEEEKARLAREESRR